MKNLLQKYKTNILFLVLLLTISLVYNYYEILSYHPYSIHQWRQADCLSITKNYFKENRSFFEPAIFWLGDKEGKTVSECPIIYYSIAQLWKVFGFHEFIFRLVDILIVFTGLFCLFKLVQEIFSNTFWAMIITFLLFTSPILVYYTNNFTADAPALGLALIACFLFWKGISKQNKWIYTLSFLFFLWAGLTKISSLISFSAIFLIHSYYVAFSKKNGWMYQWRSLIPYLVVLTIILIWYNFAFHYNQKNLNNIFLVGIYPIWEIDIATRYENLNRLYNILLPAYFNKTMLLITIEIFVCLILCYKHVNKVLFFINVIVFLGIITYMLLFYQAFTVHDYYLTNLLIFLPLPYIAFIEMLLRHYPKSITKISVKILACCIVLFLVFQTAKINRLKYSPDEWVPNTNFVLNQNTIEYYKWYHWDYTNHFKAFETISPYLLSIGIKPTDRLLSLSDNSINISLYFMDHKGYSNYYHHDKPLEEKMNYYKQNNVHYLIIDSTYSKNNENIKPYLINKIGNYKNLAIFRLF